MPDLSKKIGNCMKPEGLPGINIAVRRIATLLKSIGETDERATGFAAA
jgi:hypothetical protein